MTKKPSLGFALRRTLSSIAAIAAISAIFGVKALESEQLTAAPEKVDLAITAGGDAAH